MTPCLFSATHWYMPASDSVSTDTDRTPSSTRILSCVEKKGEAKAIIGRDLKVAFALLSAALAKLNEHSIESEALSIGVDHNRDYVAEKKSVRGQKHIFLFQTWPRFVLKWVSEVWVRASKLRILIRCRCHTRGFGHRNLTYFQKSILILVYTFAQQHPSFHMLHIWYFLLLLQ